MNRDRAVWYYQLGKRALGPVPWTEIEQITRDTIDAEDLMVGRAGDETWRSAAEVIEEIEASETAEPVGAEAEAEEVEPPAPPAPTTIEEVAADDEGVFRPVFGLGKWLAQAWQMVFQRLGAWAGAMLLTVLLSLVTLGIAGPPMLAGLYAMALDRFRGEEIAAGDVFRGFSRFVPAWGLALVILVFGAALMIPGLLFVFVVMRSAGLDSGDGLSLIALMPFAIVELLLAAVLFYAWVLVAEGHGALKAVSMSWGEVKQDFASYVGMMVVLALVAYAGVLGCYVGLLATLPVLFCAQVAAYNWHFSND